ncbi:MAG: FkbM family methyltransferase [Sphingobacteriia bacterium]
MKKTINSIVNFCRRTLANILRPISPPEFIFQRLHFRGPFSISTDGGDKLMMINYNDHISNRYFWGGLKTPWEYTSREIWRSLAKDASVILDIGAHNGSYSLEAKLANPAARVIAIEPNSNIAERAAANFRLNKFDVELENVAAGREESVLAFNGWSFLHQVGKNEVKTEIRVRRVSDLLAEKNIHHLGLLKIDI